MTEIKQVRRFRPIGPLRPGRREGRAGRQRGRYGLSDLVPLARTPVGRRQLRGAALSRLWPAAFVLGWLYRRTVARRLRIVAVVGSYGKTTTARAAATAVGSPRRIDGRNAKTYLSRRLLRSLPGGPPVVFEVGIKAPGQMETYARMLRPDVVVVTSIGSEHNISLKTIETTRREKARMVEGMRPDGVALLNGDDPEVMWMRTRARGTVRTFGFGPGHDYAAEEIELDWPHGTRFVLAGPGFRRPVRVKLMGASMIRSVLSAAAAALENGESLDLVADRLEALQPTRGRLEAVPLPQGAWVLRDDYKSGWETYDPAFDLFAEIPARRKLAVLGDITEPPGPQGELYRELGRRAAAVADEILYVGGMAKPLSAGATSAGFPRESLRRFRKVRDVAAHLAKVLEPGDVVLTKGRDHEKLERVVLVLQGRTVRCDIMGCRAGVACSSCEMLERGWAGKRVAT